MLEANWHQILETVQCPQCHVFYTPGDQCRCTQLGLPDGNGVLLLNAGPQISMVEEVIPEDTEYLEFEPEGE